MAGHNHHVFAHGTVSRSEDTLRIDTDDGEIKHLPIESVDALYLHGQLTFNTETLGLLNMHHTPMHVFGWNDYYSGSFLPKRKHKSGNTIVEQVKAYTTDIHRLQISQQITQASIHNLRENVAYYNTSNNSLDSTVQHLDHLYEDVLDCSSINEVRAVEGQARKAYYSSFNTILDTDMDFDMREYNPPPNELNSLISYCNSICYTACVTEIRKTALNPTVGYVHEPGERRFTLALDIGDIYKPIITDRILFRVINRSQISSDDFDDEFDGCYLNESGRKTILKEFEKTIDKTVKHPRLNRNVSYKTLIRTDVYSLKKHILTGEEYRPTERWW